MTRFTMTIVGRTPLDSEAVSEQVPRKAKHGHGLRVLVAFGLLGAIAAPGCRQPLGYCEQQEDCPSFAVCNLRYQVCVQPDETDGGISGDLDAGEVGADSGADALSSDGGVDAGVLDAGESRRCDGGYCGRWLDGGTLAFRRNGHTSMLLLDGRVLVVGGTNQDIAEIFDPSTGVWRPAGEMEDGTRILSVGLVLKDGRALVCGGSGRTGGYSRLCELFDPATMRWTRAASMGVPRESAVGGVLQDGTVIVAGGADFMLPHSSAEMYSPDSGTWSSLPSMRRAHRNARAAVLSSGEMVVVGGRRCPARS